jgi:hypothetical protein
MYSLSGVGVGFMRPIITQKESTPMICTSSRLANREVLVKIVGVEPPRVAHFVAFEAGGVWLRDKALADELAKSAGQQGLQIFLGNLPVAFVPFLQLQWMLASGKDIS